MMNEQQRVRTEKLRWRSRRALLELDIVLQRFWSGLGGELDEATVVTLERLLAMEDHDLWELVSGRASTDDRLLLEMAGRLRATR